MAGKRRSGRITLLFALALVGVIAGLAWQHAQRFSEHAMFGDGAPRILVVEPGDGFNAVLAHARKLGITQGSDLEWKALAVSMNVADRLQVGEYSVPPGMSPRGLLASLAKGEVIQRKFTIIPGWSFRDLRAMLQADTQLQHEIAKLSDSEIMARLKRRGVAPEGRFLPETFVYTRGTSELDILDRAAKAMDVALAKAWESRDTDLPLTTPDDMLTLASIVEKETGLASERPQIAGVFVRRLKKGMRLETDPAVIYGMGSAYAGNIRKSDLRTDTPYNTYMRAGLPPTPIASPDKAALDAVAHPAPGDALYFVATGGRSSVFSATYEEHSAAVRKYQLKH